jgi:Arc/MetJ family transcription regulator
MRVTIDIDDDLLIKASSLVGPLDHSALINEGLKALNLWESGRRLARLGGTQRSLKAAPRRRAKDRR